MRKYEFAAFGAFGQSGKSSFMFWSVFYPACFRRFSSVLPFLHLLSMRHYFIINFYINIQTSPPDLGLFTVFLSINVFKISTRSLSFRTGRRRSQAFFRTGQRPRQSSEQGFYKETTERFLLNSASMSRKILYHDVNSQAPHW